MQTATVSITADSTAPQREALRAFRSRYPTLFQKHDRLLLFHLISVIAPLLLFSALAVRLSWLPLKVISGTLAGLFWFALINVTIHHHTTHFNAAESAWTKSLLNGLYFLVPNSGKRKSRYIRAHLNHHARPFHETDVDHLFGLERYLRMSQGLGRQILYFLELSFVGSYIPGWDEDAYMNKVPIDQWNLENYEAVMEKEKVRARWTALWQWGTFITTAYFIPLLGWGWIFPMLLVKNWAHYLGQFQHYDVRLLDGEKSIWQRTKTYRVPGWFNYLMGGEISGHFVHHLFPQIPYYKIETARKVIERDPELSKMFVNY